MAIKTKVKKRKARKRKEMYNHVKKQTIGEAKL
jgi:hypothetical protein